MLYNYKGIHIKRNIETLDFIQREYTANEVKVNTYFFGRISELVYVAREEDEEINRLLANHLGFINKVAERFGLHVIYIPTLAKLLSNEDVQRYRLPCIEPKDISEEIGNDYLLKYFSDQDDRAKCKQGFIWIPGTDSTRWLEYFPVSSTGSKSIAHQLFEIFILIFKKKKSEQSSLVYGCELIESGGRTEEYADDKFNSQQEESIDDLMDEIRVRVQKLRQRGIAERVLIDLLHPQNELSRLLITRDYRIFLPDYNNIEIQLQPIIKAVYLLFLSHPEGMMFKELPDYRQELTEIYLKLKPNGMTEKVKKSIEDVTNPTLNSINEKCARIRGAFIEQFDEHLAKYYYIDGMRAMPKTIALPRELVVWE